MEKTDDTMEVEDVQEDSNGEEDDSSSGDEMHDAEEASLQEITAIEEKLLQAPYDYKSHTELIQLLRKVGELEKLRIARTIMSKIFPLTQALWLEWIEDEKKFAESEDDHAQLHLLFEKAVKDYMCPDIWLEYSQYCIRWMGSDEGLKKIRDVMERAIAAVGLHVSEGAAIWEMYREFENALLLSMQPKPGSIPTAEQQETIKKQMDKISGLFKGQLSTPLYDMERTFQEYADWSENDVDNSTKHTYEQALKQLEELKPYEEALMQASSPKLEAYQNYINHEIKFGSSARVQCIYERALVDNCLNSELWQQYLKYMGYQPNPPELLAELHLRSVRNCPWIGQLWVSYLLALERCNSTKEKLKEVFDEAINAGFTSAYEYIELWKTRCSQLRRAMSVGNKEQDKTELRECFQHATRYVIERLIPAFGDSGDPTYTLWTFWANCEADVMKDAQKSREILQNLLQEDADARRKLRIYRELVDIERVHGADDKLDKIRSILRQAVQNCAILPDSIMGGVPDAEVACEMLMDFERLHGTLKDMDESHRRVTNKMQRITQRRGKEAAAAEQKQASKNKKQWQQKPQSKKQQGKQHPKDVQRKRKARDDNQDSNKGVPAKQQRLDKPSEPKVDEGFKAPAGLPVRYVKKAKVAEPAQETASTSGPPPGFKGKPSGVAKGPPPGFKKPPPGFKPPSDENNNKDKDDQSATVSVDKEGADADKKTIFISNLNYNIENLEEKLRSIFCNCGKITSVRLVRKFGGQFKGYCYVAFSEESEATEALKLDREILEGRPMYVSPNVDKKKQPNFKVFKYDGGLERHKLFVSRLSFKTTTETLREEFSQHGPLKDLRIVTTRRGMSKGLAYVEYEKESDAAQALLKLDGKMIDRCEIKVEISNPPSRRPENQESFKSERKQSLKTGRGRGRTQLSMVPRSIQRSDKTTNGSKGESSQPSTSSGMSNKDFANLLLKK